MYQSIMSGNRLSLCNHKAKSFSTSKQVVETCLPLVLGFFEITVNKDPFFTVPIVSFVFGSASGAGGASVLARPPVASSLAVKK